MIRKFITELLAEVGITLPEKKEKELPIVNDLTLRNQFTAKYEFAETWEVRWLSRHGDYSGDTSPQVAAFTSRGDAEQFAMALKAAYKMLRHTHGTGVVVEKNKYSA
jgi:hypothetical protein